ncbi:glycoside hydrolase family 47 protein [bacterium]|nr:glycoside hydrolase family 47 protein [bacterium]
MFALMFVRLFVRMFARLFVRLFVRIFARLSAPSFPLSSVPSFGRMTASPRRLLFAAALLPALAAAVAPPAARAQSGAPVLPADPAAAADRVRDEFRHAWQGYVRCAWGHDDLRPLSCTGADWYGASLLMTPVDAFSTMKLMGLEEEALAAKDLILSELDFDRDLDVQLFEIDIRLLGGLLSAYQLDGDDRFLALATDLADRLLPAFDSPTGMPYRYVNLRTGAVRDPLNNPAEIGTLLLEWGTLSRHTDNPVYWRKAKAAVMALAARRSAIGLPGTIIDVETGAWTDREAALGARVDSYYEYLLKGWLMFGDEDLHRLWDESIVAIGTYLADTSTGSLWYGQADMDTGERTGTRFGALEAFFPAVLALSGDLERAAALQRSCFRMWQIHGIEPEVIDYTTMEVLHEGYPLRPENIESAWYLLELTGDEGYRDMGRTYVESLIARCRTEVGYAHLASVRTGEQRDAMQSFFLAETLKYAWLLFAPRGTIDFERTLFNTEAHPLRVWPE